jgi:hypothetical protein
MKATSRRVLACGLAIAAASTAAVLACGPFFVNLLTGKDGAPIDRAGYARGELGVVKPTFARRYLVQAYRTLGGTPPIAADVLFTATPPTAGPPAWLRWEDLQRRELPPSARQALTYISPARIAADYSSFDNCLDAAFTRALDTYGERMARYGARSIETIEWLTAQAAVFQNCRGGPLVLPAAAPPGASTAIQADRDYQTASAYFYATQYDEAAGRFRALASNAASPWRASGRYLAARALIRSVTVPSTPPKDAAQRLTAATRDLEATLTDRDASALHASARGLIDYIAVLTRPAQRLREISARLATAQTVAPQDLVDYTRLMDRALGPTPSGKPRFDVAEIAKGDDLTDWILAFQEGNPRAGERWRETRSERWLVAALWAAEPGDAQAPALIAAAAQVPRTSRAFATAAILRVRLLIQRNDLAAARTALAALPSAPTTGIDAETINLLRDARFTVAATLDEMLAQAQRIVVSAEGEGDTQPPEKFTKPVWDFKVAAVFNGRMPLGQLVATAESTRLPSRLRLRVAQAAFTRAVVLDQAQPGIRAARVVAALAPALRADLARYIAAPDENARRRIATLTLLRTSGLSINVEGEDTDDSYQRDTPMRRFGHAYLRNWWCPSQIVAFDSARPLAINGLPFPQFVSEEERRETGTELEALQTAGTPRERLLSAAIAWAETRRTDPEAAEALALAIEGWRWSACDSNAPKSDLPRRAFALLHRQFPDSDWAKNTKYWYD